MINLILKIFAGLGLIALSPIILICIFIIIIEDGLPAIFVQERLGKNLKNFNIYKIRTMHLNTPNLGTHEVSSSSYLKIGFILRKLKIDELPQVINFLKGELNLVGPRPGLPSQEELKKFRLNSRVFDINPGITGLAQVLGYDMSNPEKLAKIDSLYIEKKSIKLDLIIFFATFIKSYRKKLLTTFAEEIKVIESRKYNV
jgi:lipopolysaccharide/colanic/teichoic acid biosynthesis glycosyltransferase